MKYRAPLVPLLAYWRTRTVILGGFLTLLVIAVSAAPFIWAWEEAVDLYLLFHARGARPAPDNVIIVPIDNQAARRIFLPESPKDFEDCRDVRLDQAIPGFRNPDPPEVLTRWPRCLHARALKALTEAMPEAVVIDILFRPRNDPSGPSGVFSVQDKKLAAAINGLRKVILAQKLKSGQQADEHPEAIAGPIEEAALGVAPFLVLGDQLQRTEKFCTFMETDGWWGPCLPVVAHQAVALDLYPNLRELLERASAEDAALLPETVDDLLEEGALQGPVQVIRHLVVSHENAGNGLRALLAHGAPDNDLSFADNERLRRLLDAYLGAAFRYLNFYGPPGAFRTLDYAELVAGGDGMRPRPGSLRGKIIFMGFAEYKRPEQIEHFPTPFTTADSIKLSGVELAATAFANLQDGSSVEPVAPWMRAMIVLALAMVCTLICVGFSPLRALPLFLALSLLYLGTALYLFRVHSIWLPLLVPLGFAAPLVVSAGFASRYIELKRQRNRIQGVIGSLLPRRLVDRIINSNQMLAQMRESVYGTCVFTDAARYTTLAESLPPEQVARFLDDYFQALFPIVQERGGETIDVVGDAMVAVWAGPTPNPELRARACLASLQLAATAERFRETHPDTPVSTRIGVDYGPMSIGMVGTQFHEEYRPVGDVPNTASRLQELNKQLGTRLLVSEPVIAGLDGFLVRDLGSFQLRGRTHATHVYELICERASATPQQVELCESFGRALAAYHAGRCDEARASFESALLLNPGDGPCAFYVGLSAEGKEGKNVRER